MCIQIRYCSIPLWADLTRGQVDPEFYVWSRGILAAMGFCGNFTGFDAVEFKANGVGLHGEYDADFNSSGFTESCSSTYTVKRS